MRDTRAFKIIIDVHERDNPISKKLMTLTKAWGVKEGAGYDPTADYIIIDRAGREWGIERKSFLDCWQSICSKRVDGQLSQLCKKYPNRAILMLEAPPPRMPRNLMHKTYAVHRTVFTFFSDRSLLMPCWYIMDSNAGANILIKFARRAHMVEIHGRGLQVVMEHDEV